MPQLRSNRSGHATTVLGAVRARHNDIERIERTLLELNQLFRDLTEQIDIQNPLVQQTEVQTEHVKADTEAANVQLNKSIVSAKCARRIKWIICIILTLIVLGVALGVGLWFGVFQKQPGRWRQAGADDGAGDGGDCDGAAADGDGGGGRVVVGAVGWMGTGHMGYRSAEVIVRRHC